MYNAAAWLVDRHIETGAGERTAFRVDGVGTDYAALQREVWRVQQALRQLDVRRGERVALVLDDELAFPAWFLGALRSGVVPVPLSTMLKPEELAAIVGDALASVAVVSAGYRGYVDAFASADGELRHAVVVGEPEGGEVVPTHAWSTFDDRTEAPVAATIADSPAFWLYSSGTTGLPKGVMHRHGSPQATAETFARAVLEIGPDDRCLSVAKLFFAYGLGNSLTFPLSVGAGAVLNPRRPTPPEVAALVHDEHPTLFFASPGFVAALLDTDLPDDTFASVRLTITAGEALPADLQRRFSSRFGHPVLDGIGTTEALHMFMSNTGRRGTARHEWPARRRLRGPSDRRVRRGGGGGRHAGLPRGARTVARHRVLEPGRGDAGGVPRRVVVDRRRVHTLRGRLLDVPRAQQRHDQGRRDLGVAGRGRSRAGRAPRRAGGGCRRRS